MWTSPNASCWEISGPHALRLAGNVALTFDARAGVYIAGGISPRIVDFMRRSQFRLRFEGRVRAGFNNTSNPYPYT